MKISRHIISKPADPFLATPLPRKILPSIDFGYFLKGELMWPPPPPPEPKVAPVAKKPAEVEKPVLQAVPVDPRVAKLKSAIATSVGMTGLIGLGMASPTPAFTHMLSTFGLSTIVGKSHLFT